MPEPSPGPGTVGGDILFLSEQVPLPAEHGSPARSYQLLRWLARHRRVHLVSLARDTRHVNGLKILQGLTRSRAIFWHPAISVSAAARSFLFRRSMTVARARNDDLREALRGILARRNIATIFAASPAVAQHLPAAALARTIVDFGDARPPANGDEGSPTRWLAGREQRLFLKEERKLMRRVKAGLFTGPADAALFEDPAFAGPRHVVGNGIDTDFFDPAVSFKRADRGISLVFAAPMNVAANEEAAIWFAEEVLPVLRGRHGEVGFSIVGEWPSQGVKELRLLHEGVRVVGAVRDVRSWLAGASIVVVPLRRADAGSATLLQAMAMARPVVASSVAAQGYDVNGAIHVADGPEMVDAISALIADPRAAAALGDAARERVARFSWERQLSPLAPEFGFAP